MIDDYKTAFEMLDKLRSFATANSLAVDVQGSSFTPTPSISYVKESLLQNENNALGLSATADDEQLPIYQVLVHTPKGQGKFVNLIIVNKLRAEFPRASFILNDGTQKVQVESVSSSPLTANDTHNITAVSINLIVYASNT